MKEETKELQAFNSTEYWQKRYENGGNSGAGSYGHLCQFKINYINELIDKNDIKSVIDWGCGDGNQVDGLDLVQQEHNLTYLGFDVSPIALYQCRRRHLGRPWMQFFHTDEYSGQQAELGLSLDVIYHLVEDNVFNAYMRRLCDSSTKYLVIYSSNSRKVELPAVHLRERQFTDWMIHNRPDWQICRISPNEYPYHVLGPAGSISDFYVYRKVGVMINL